MSKFYLAARYARRDELKGYAAALEAIKGVEVTSRWLQEEAPLDSNMGDHKIEFYKDTAAIDIEDIDRAHAVVFFSEDPLVGVPRGGRHFEMGYAHAKGKSVYVIGVKENVFHYRARVYHYDTFEKFLKVIKSSDIVK